MKIMYPFFAFLVGCATPVEHEIIFLDDFCVKPHVGYKYRTCCDIKVLIDRRLVFIPEGFETDLASIPRFMWVLLAPSHSKLMAPSILHDFLYKDPLWMSRREADDVFYSAMIHQGFNRWVSWRMWEAVRLFGNRFFVV